MRPFLPTLGALLLGLALLTPTPAQAVTASAGGFGEIRFSAQPGVDGTWWNLTERVRPRFQAQLHERIAVAAEIEMLFVQGRNPRLEIQTLMEESDFGPLLELAEVEWPTYANEVLQIDSIADVLSVERLYVDFYLPFMDLRVGRQALFWGSSMMINPTDPFPEFLLAEPWRQRAGTNAVRAIIPFNEDIDFTAVFATNDIFTKMRAAGRLRLRLPFADLALVAAFRQDDLDGLLGVDLRGELGVGWWFEGSLHIQETIYEEFAVGVDYSFPVLDGLIVMAQYYRNGAGAGPKDEPTLVTGRLTNDLPPELGEAFSGAADTADADVADPKVFAPLLGGRDYLLLTVNQVFAPEVSLSFVALQNLDDGTGFMIPSVTVSPTGWLQFALNAQIPYRLWGDGGEFKPDPDSLIVSQEIGPFNQLYEADFSGLLPDATITFWTRASF
ncbi:MAG: hypothetical protein KDA24_12165 [Deltaproteobacteria bacterium]|nr:hypothetical protein [Deltaproteobacteria bacterium]